MMYSGISKIAALAAFILVAAAVNQVITGLTPILAGMAAAYYVDRFLQGLDTRRALEVCKTRSEHWTLPYPQAFGAFRQALQTFLYEGEQPHRFTVILEDEQRGIIKAYLHINEAHPGLTRDIGRNPMTIYLDAKLTPAAVPGTTQSTWSFRLTGVRTIEGEQAILNFNRELLGTVQSLTPPPPPPADCRGGAPAPSAPKPTTRPNADIDRAVRTAMSFNNAPKKP